MKCAICGIEVDSIDEAIDEGWIPYIWEGNQEKEGPYCGSCSEILIQINGKSRIRRGILLTKNPRRNTCQQGLSWNIAITDLKRKTVEAV